MKKTFTLRNKNSAIAILMIVLIISFGCKKLAYTPSPPDRIDYQNAFESDEPAIAVLTGLYIRMSGEGVFTGNSSINLFSGLSSDELTLYNGVTWETYTRYYKNQLKSDMSLSVGAENWGPLFQYIFQCNTVIEGLTASNGLTAEVKQQLLGEAKFLRAFCYFYLVNLFGEVPLVLNLDYNNNVLSARVPRAQVYQQIIKDLLDANELLSENYLDGSLKVYADETERTRPSRWSAKALLSRVYLFTNEWTSAESTASELINASNNAGQLFNLLPLNSVFLKNSAETIWQLQPVTSGQNTCEGKVFIIPSTGLTTGTDNTNPVYLSSMLLQSFETGDNRGTPGNWVDTITIDGALYYYPFKYKIRISPEVTTPADLIEYFMVFRLSEQYLIRAEARAQTDNISGAKSDLDAIRQRAGLLGTTAIDKNSILEAIYHERQVELFSEWGTRWLDIKRTGNVDAIMGAVTPLKANGAAWESHQQLYPIPFSDIQSGPNLIQNTGY